MRPEGARLCLSRQLHLDLTSVWLLLTTTTLRSDVTLQSDFYLWQLHLSLALCSSLTLKLYSSLTLKLYSSLTLKLYPSKLCLSLTLKLCPSPTFNFQSWIFNEPNQQTNQPTAPGARWWRWLVAAWGSASVRLIRVTRRVTRVVFIRVTRKVTRVIFIRVSRKVTRVVLIRVSCRVTRVTCATTLRSF